MENNYEDVANDEIIENPNMQTTYDSIHCFEYYILVTTALSTILGGFLLNDLASNDQKDQLDCRVMVMTINYYSHYLLIDGSAQLIIYFFVICILSYFKKQDSKRQVSRQLLYQVIDTGFSLLTLVTIQVVLQYKQYCISYGVGIFLIVYSFWVYLLFFFLVVAKTNQ